MKEPIEEVCLVPEVRYFDKLQRGGSFVFRQKDGSRVILRADQIEAYKKGDLDAEDPIGLACREIKNTFESHVGWCRVCRETSIWLI